MGKPLTPEQRARREAQHEASLRSRAARRRASLSDPALALLAPNDIRTPAQALACAIHRQWGHGSPTGLHVSLDVSSAQRLLFEWPLDVDLVRGEGPSDAALLDPARPDWWSDAASYRAAKEELLSFLPAGWRLMRVRPDEIAPREDPDGWERRFRASLAP